MKLKNYYYLDSYEHFSDMLKGDKGDSGNKGFEGAQGDVGLRGLKGPIGLQGLIGAKGIQGPRGNRGDIGDPGKMGEPGDSGVKGVKGVVGPTGEKGSRGLRGNRGDIGIRGNRGKDGPSGGPGPLGDSGYQFSRYLIDSPGSNCQWINVPQDPSSQMPGGRCPGNKGLGGIRTRRWNAKLQTQVNKPKCKRKGGCKPHWVVDHSLTRWQVNREYDICCLDMPFGGSNNGDIKNSGNERIDNGWGTNKSSLNNYPFHEPS